MSKGMYVGVDNLARKIKRGYVGVDNVARKIKKAYVGVGGVARPFYSADLLSYYGELDPPTTTRFYATFGSLHNPRLFEYALFAGGSSSSSAPSTVYSTVDAYSDTLVHSNPDNLATARYKMASAHVGYYMTTGVYTLFAGGNSASSTVYSTVDAYSDTLVHSKPSALGGSRARLAGATVGRVYSTDSYALFAGGCNSSGSTYYSNVYAYDKSLARTTATALTQKRSDLAGENIGDYALFVGGWNNSTSYNVADVYSNTLVHSDLQGMTYGGAKPVSASVYNPDSNIYYGLFVAMDSGSSTHYEKYVQAYSSSLVKSQLANLFDDMPNNRVQFLLGTSFKNNAVFYGVNTEEGIYNLSIFTSKLVKVTQDIIDYGWSSSGYVGNYLLFAKSNKVISYIES